MIKEFCIHAKPQNKKARYAFFASLGSAMIVCAVYLLVDKYKSLVGIGVMTFITAAIYIYNRYIGSEYYYEITADHIGTPVFVVRQKIGKRESTLCRIDLGSIVKIDKMTAAEKKKHMSDKDVMRYVYCPTMMPDTVYLLTVRSHNEKADIFIEATDEMAEVISSYAEQIRTQDTEY